MSPAVTVIIVNFNSGDRLARCLRHLAAQTSKNFDVIVFDNASSDGSERAAETDTPGGPIVRLMRSEDNIGFAAGNNRASTEASGEWLAFLNPDAYADPDWIEQLLSGAERHAGVEVFGSTQLNADAPDIIDGAGDVYHAFGVPYRGGFGWPAEKLPGGDRECFAPCAAAALFRRSTFEALGGFEETFFATARMSISGFATGWQAEGPCNCAERLSSMRDRALPAATAISRSIMAIATGSGLITAICRPPF